MDKKQLTKLVSYFTMGDGGVYFAGKECRFQMNMKTEHMDYITWVVKTLENITTVSIRDVVRNSDDGYDRKPLTAISTKLHPFFTTLRDRIYTGNYKGIDPHTLKLLDFESLAILYMSDGSLYLDKRWENKHYTVSLCMKRLSYGDQYILKKALKDNLDLEWNINRHGKYYFLRLRNKDVTKFMEGVRPHILPSFEYKLIRTNSPCNKGDDIVCASQECEEVSRND